MCSDKLWIRQEPNGITAIIGSVFIYISIRIHISIVYFIRCKYKICYNSRVLRDEFVGLKRCFLRFNGLSLNYQKSFLHRRTKLIYNTFWLWRFHYITVIDYLARRQIKSRKIKRPHRRMVEDTTKFLYIKCQHKFKLVTRKTAIHLY